jgi:hypothetical protein
MRRVFPLWVLLGSLATAPAADGPRKRTDAVNMGLQGPVHTVKLETNRLPDYTRLHAEVPGPAFAPWMIFDPTGSLIERADSLAPDGTPEVISRERKGPDGLSETEVIRGGQSTIWRSEHTLGPHGPIETRNYRDGILQSFAEYNYDAKGNNTDQILYDPAGKPLNRSISRYDDAGRVVEWEVRGLGGQFQLHVLDAYASDGDLLGRDALDADGRIILSMAFRQARLISSWHAPECRDVPMGFTVSTGDRSVAYAVNDDCSLDMTVERHPGREGNIENDGMERFNEAGQSLEKLAFQYERDDYGNWVRRTVSAWDTTTNSYITVEEDARIITYYK